jgi:hypothetical protein
MEQAAAGWLYPFSKTAMLGQLGSGIAISWRLQGRQKHPNIRSYTGIISPAKP